MAREMGKWLAFRRIKQKGHSPRLRDTNRRCCSNTFKFFATVSSITFM